MKPPVKSRRQFSFVDKEVKAPARLDRSRDVPGELQNLQQFSAERLSGRLQTSGAPPRLTT
jgi:hypothetical protein